MSKLGLSKKLYALLSLGVATSFTASCACSANAGVEDLQVNYDKDKFSSSFNPFSATPTVGNDMSYAVIQLAEFEGWNISYNNNEGAVLTPDAAKTFKDIFDNGRSGKDNNGQPWLALRWIGADKTLTIPTWNPTDPKDSSKGGSWAPTTPNADPKKSTYSPYTCYQNMHDNNFYAVFDFAKYQDGKANWVTPVAPTGATLASFTTGLKLTFSFANIKPSYFAAPSNPNDSASWSGAVNTNSTMSGLISLQNSKINFIQDKSLQYTNETMNFFFTGDANTPYSQGATSLLKSAVWTPLS